MVESDEAIDVATQMKYWQNERIGRRTQIKYFLSTHANMNINETHENRHSRNVQICSNFEDIDDAAWKYDRYIEKKHSFRPRSFADIETLKEYEVLKISYVYDSLNEQLENNSHLDERAWQSLMAPLLPLIFPKYIRVLQSVKIKDQYSNINSSTRRFIDLAMLDASGNLDIIEIKKPTSSQ